MILINGKNLTTEQKAQLNFKGAKNPEWVNNHSFYFNEDGTLCKEDGYTYPVCHSLSHLPY